MLKNKYIFITEDDSSIDSYDTEEQCINAAKQFLSTDFARDNNIKEVTICQLKKKVVKKESIVEEDI